MRIREVGGGDGKNATESGEQNGGSEKDVGEDELIAEFIKHLRARLS